MIRSFRHKGLQRYFETGSTAGIHARHARKISLRLAVLNQAIRPADVDLPGFFLHPLTGDRKGIWAVTVSGNWRIAFRDGDVFVVNYEDYH